MADFATTEEEAEKVRIRARARVKAEGLYEQPDTSPKELVKRWNKGVVDLISAPTDMINAGIRLSSYVAAPPALKSAIKAGATSAIPQLPAIGQPERQMLADWGLIPDPTDPAEGFLEHSSEILGAGTIPYMMLHAKGVQLLNQSIVQLERMGVMKSIAIGTAARPMAAASGEAVASVGAGTGRSVAEYNNASPQMQIMAELLGGFSPIAFIGAAKSMSAVRYIANSLQKHLLPFTKPGAWQRASKRMRDLAANPEKAAASIDLDSPIPPARQAGDERLLALEKAVLDENPELASETNKLLDGVREILKDEVLGLFGGSKNRPRDLLIQGKQYLIDLLDMRAASAADNVQARLSELDPNASPREINQRVRTEVDTAYKDARDAETELWKSIDSDAPVDVVEAKAKLAGELQRRSRFDDPEDIPAWVIKSLGPEEVDPRILKQLQKAGAVDSNGNFLPGMEQRLVDEGILTKGSYTFNDARTIRSRLLREVRVEQAKDAPNRNKIRVLSDVADGLLDDIGTSGVEGADAAREFSRSLNEKFTRGQVGRLLGYDRTGAERISEKATLDYLLAGKDPQTNITQLVEAAPQTKPMIEDYLKAEFIAQTNAGANRRAANRFIDKWERRGAFEQYPELQDKLTRYSDDLAAAESLGVRADKVRSFSNKSGKSTAALYLGADPGNEMRAILNSKRPATNARKLMAKMSADTDAESGLRTTFLEEGFNQSSTNKFYTDGTPIYSGDKFTSYLNEYKSVAKELGVTDIEWQRMETIALRMRQLDATPGTSVGKSVQDAPSAIMDLAARYIGAQQGGRLGNSMGSSLVMAGAFSSRVRRVLDGLNRNTAKQLLIDAHKDPALYRALLTNPTMSDLRQEKAAKTITAWMVGVGATQKETE